MPVKPPLYRAPGARTHRQHKAAHDRRRGTAHQRGYDRDWRRLRDLKMANTPWCERCDLMGITTLAFAVNHRVPVEERPDLRLVYENLESLCEHHHNAVVQREEANARASGRPTWLKPSLIPLHIVCGAMASGKSTWVRTHAGPADLVVDLDAIACAIARIPFTHDWDRRHLEPALRERNAMLAALSERARLRWPQAWFIVSEPTPQGRAAWSAMLKPESVTIIETPPETCLERVKRADDRAARLDIASRAIAAWWEAYEPAPGEHRVPGH